MTWGLECSFEGFFCRKLFSCASSNSSFFFLFLNVAKLSPEFEYLLVLIRVVNSSVTYVQTSFIHFCPAFSWRACRESVKPSASLPLQWDWMPNLWFFFSVHVSSLYSYYFHCLQHRPPFADLDACSHGHNWTSADVSHCSSSCCAFLSVSCAWTKFISDQSAFAWKQILWVQMLLHPCNIGDRVQKWCVIFTHLPRPSGCLQWFFTTPDTSFSITY